MVSYEPFLQHQLYQQTFGTETGSVEGYLSTTMDYNYSDSTTTAFTNNFPFMFSELPPSHGDNLVDFKFEMERTPSTTSMHRISQECPPMLSNESIGSASSSNAGSPFSGHVNTVLAPEICQYPAPYLSRPTIFVDDEGLQQGYGSGHDLTFSDHDNKFLHYTSVDPNLLTGPRDILFAQQPYTYPQSTYTGYSNSSAPSPVPSNQSYGNFSQPLAHDSYTYTRGASVISQSAPSPRTSVSSDDEGVEKGRCTYPDCGRVYKDLKAHMLTHLGVRPEKCPIPTCDYHTKGFARKYDKNRHTLTHYKGTMVCPFCPGSGSSAEKSFNRADVFKRHLTTVHRVEQNPPNSRKRSPSGSSKKSITYCEDAAGKCSTCSATFNNAQDFYEHLDDCVLRVVQLAEPSEAINEQCLASVASDSAVQEIFARNMIKEEHAPSFDFEEDDDEDDYDEEDDDEYENLNPDERSGRGFLKSSKTSGPRAVIGGSITKNKSGRKANMTWSKIGVPLTGKGRKKRKDYPPSWGMAADKMKMKKRVLCVYDGARRLLKDDMMLSNDFEVRVPIGEGKYVTDLDVKSMDRAVAFHGATDEEKGPWMPEQEIDLLMG